jgi:nucleoside-diphosphate-sugar epimerase
MSITRLTTDTGFTPEYTFPEAIAHYLSWRKVNPR